MCNPGWVLADSNGKELAVYSKLWRLPAGGRIHSGAYRAHGISAATVQREGIDPKPELMEFGALVTAVPLALLLVWLWLHIMHRSIWRV